MPEPFDRDRALDGLDWLDAIYGGDVAEGAPSQMRDVADAARWAVEVTEGDGIWWCERHQCRWGYTPDCGWSPRGEACPKSRRLLIEWESTNTVRRGA